MLPVKANGEVRLRSVASVGRTGSEVTPELERAALLRRRRGALLELLDDVLELRAEEDRHDRRRRLVGAEAMVVAGVGDARPEQVGVDVHAADDRDEERQELGVGVRVVARVEQVLAVVGGHRPVVVLARAVDAGERLLVDEEHQAVLRREPAHRAMTIMLWSEPTEVGS